MRVLGTLARADSLVFDLCSQLWDSCACCVACCTLSPLKASEGGGLAVAPGSSCASWSEKCRAVIENKPGERPLTCRLAELSPEYNGRLDAMKALHDMEPGDAIFHSRYCFHKGEQFDKGDTKLRYSIRYMPADARFFDIGDYEAATREKGLTDGAPLAHAGEYYPQVWPRPIRGERWRVRLGLLKQDGFTKPPPVPSS